MLNFAFPAMRQCDCNIIEFSEKGVGLGINAGYCYAIGKPIFIIAKTGSDISTTISNLATKVIFYDSPNDLIEPFRQIVADFNVFKINNELKKHIETINDAKARANSLFKSQNYSQAIEEYTKLLDFDPENKNFMSIILTNKAL